MTTIQFTKGKAGRKQLAAIIATHLGATADYLGTPSFAYRIGQARLERDWTLHLPEGVEATTLVQAATQAGFTTVPTGRESEPAAKEVGLTVVLPTSGWDETTAGKVEATLAAKGQLIARALQITATPMRINVEAETISFPWFDTVPDAQVVQATMVLLARIVEHAKTATRVSAKPVKTGGNDKYAMRCWLVRLGLIGEETKPVRRTLLKHLEGNAAWKTCPTTHGAS